MNGLYLEYESYSRSHRMRISSFRYEGEPFQKAHDKTAPEGKCYILQCKCGSNDWTDNGRHINEYECNSCGLFLTAIEFKAQELRG